MKKFYLLASLFIFSLILSSCIKQQENSFTSEEEPGFVKYTDFNVEYLRMDYLKETGTTWILRSQEELADYYETYKNILLYDYIFQDYFNPETSKYNVDYFQTRAVIIIYITESSGSVRHKITSYRVGTDSVKINLNRFVPEIGTCDMAYWHICLELSKDTIENCQDVQVIQNTINS